MFGRRSEEQTAQDSAEELNRREGGMEGLRKGGMEGGGSLIWWLVRIQELFGEGVDLVGPSDFVRQ